MLGPALLKYGTEAQKLDHLPKIARGEIRWCQGYSEPGAGSDLAGLQTWAEDAGDHFVVNGQKIWTSYADKADWIFCLVRTDKSAKQGGISFVLFDMESPGVTTKPILLISGNSPFCETFFDDVKVSKANLLGELNKGWDVAKYLLGHEREMISGMGLGHGGKSLPQIALEAVGADGDGRLDEPVLRARIALFEVRAAAFRAMSERFMDELKAGKAHPAQPSMMKYYGTELNKSRHELLMAAGGSDALEWTASAPTAARRRGRGCAPRPTPSKAAHPRCSSTSSPSASSSCREPDAVPLFLNDDQVQLADSAKPFMAEQAPVGHMRALRDASDSTGFSRELWKQFAEMGFTGILVDEQHGGLGLGHVEAGIVLEEIGRNLTPSPFLPTAVGAVAALNAGGAAQRERWLPGIVKGEVVAGLAIDEGSRHRPARTAMKAERAGNGFRLVGEKSFVALGHVADLLIVLARTSGAPGEMSGLTLFAVERGAGRPSAQLPSGWRTPASPSRLRFEGVELDADAVIGEVDGGAAGLAKVLAAGRTGASAELLGVGAGAMALTVDYLKSRKQFGVHIGSFQALQHRAAHLYSELEVAPRRGAEGSAAAGRRRSRRRARHPGRQGHDRSGHDAVSAGGRADARRHGNDR